MKKFLLLALIFLCGTSARADDFFDFDFKFLNDPFAGQKMVTSKEFEQALSSKTPKQKEKKKKEPSKFTKWFWGVPQDSPSSGSQVPHYFSDAPSEIGQIKNAISVKPVLTLGAQIQDNSGAILASGHYQVDLKNIEGQNYIVFLQAHQTVGKFKASPCEDNYNKNAVIYARIDDKGDAENGYLRVIFSNLDGTFQGFGRIVEPETPRLLPLF